MRWKKLENWKNWKAEETGRLGAEDLRAEDLGAGSWEAWTQELRGWKA